MIKLRLGKEKERNEERRRKEEMRGNGKKRVEKGG